MRLLNNTRLRKYISGYIRTLKLMIEMNKNKNPRVYIFCTPLSTNLGDHAITLAEKYFFRTYFKDLNICEIPILYTDILLRTVKRKISSKDLIVINGGGFMGDEWFIEETSMRKVISEFTENIIVVFPQTIHYSNTDAGYEEFINSKKIYLKHKNLYLFAREKKSYEIMNKAYINNQVFICPDIALFGGFRFNTYKRNGILICLRNDIETQLDNSFQERIYEELSLLGEEINKTDTVIERYVSIKDREKYVVAKLNDFAKAKLVVTDRLHGMIFCAITGTPCIVYGNNNHKVEGVYAWLKDLKYVYFIEKSNDILLAAKSLINIEKQQYDEILFRTNFKPLLDLIKRINTEANNVFT